MAQKSKTAPPRESKPAREPAPKTSSPTPPPAPRRRWRLPLLIFVLLLVGVYFAPTLVAVTPLRQQIIPGLFPLLAAKSNVGSASLGWFSSVVLYDVKLTDMEDQPILDTAKVTSEHTLAGLILDQTHLGGFLIEQPTAHVLLRDDGSNIEDAIAPMIASEEPTKPKEFSLEVTGGTIHVKQQHTEEGAWRFAGLKCSLDLPLEGKQSVAVSATLAPDDDAHAGASHDEASIGGITSDVAWRIPLADDAGDGDTGTATIILDRLPLEAARAALRRFGSDLRLAGSTTGKAQMSWNAQTGRFSMNVDQLQGEQLAVAAPQLLAEDEVRLGDLRLSGGMNVEAGEISVEQVSLETAVGSMTASGSIRPDDLQQEDMLDALFRPQLTTAGRVDLAKLAALLPQTLHVREGTRITSGEVSWDVVSREQAGRRRLVGRLDATSLAAESAGQRLSWEQPVQLTLAVEDSAEGPVVEQLECKSSFLDVRGAGTARAASLTVDCNLDQLASELGRFIALDDLQLAGQATANLAWNRADDGELSANGTAEFNQLTVAIPGARPWREQRLTAEFDAAGRFDNPDNPENAESLRLDRGKLLVKSGDDLLDVELTAPVAGVTSQSAFPIRGRFAGRIAAWLARVQAFLPLDGWQIDGTADLSTAGRVSLDGAELASVQGEIQQLSAVSDGIWIAEPRVVLDSERLVLKLSEAVFSADDLTLSSSALAVRGTAVHAELQEKSPHISGKLALNSDLHRVAAWFDDPAAPAPLDYYGSAFGEVSFDASGGSLSAAVDVAASKVTIVQQPLAAGENPEVLWQEPSVRIFGKASYDVKHGTAGLENLTVQSNALQLTASGKLAEIGQRLRVDLDGSLAINLEPIPFIIRDSLLRYRNFDVGDDFLQIVGKSNEPFAIHGPVFASSATSGASPAKADELPVVSNELTANAGFSWTAARVYQIDIGQGRFDAKLKNGVMTGTSLDLPVSGGRVRFAPSVLLNQQPMVLVHPPAQVIENLQITPSMCRTWLKYVAPVLADATEVKGQFSTELEGAMVPIFTPLDGKVKGRLAIHSAQVGPGPLGQKILNSVHVLEPVLKGRPLQALMQPGAVWIAMPEQTVEFEMVDRGVRHKDLTFMVGDVIVKTSGTVGFDESLDLVATIPIRDEWIKGPLMAGWKGKSVTVPIKGKLKSPEIDVEPILRDMGRNFLQGAPGNLLEDQINKGLDKLFGK